MTTIGARMTSAPRTTRHARTGVTEKLCRDGEYSIAIDFLLFFVATNIFLLRQTFQRLLSRQIILYRDRVCPTQFRDRVSCVATGLGDGTTEARKTERLGCAIERAIKCTGCAIACTGLATALTTCVQLCTR